MADDTQERIEIRDKALGHALTYARDHSSAGRTILQVASEYELFLWSGVHKDPKSRDQDS